MQKSLKNKLKANKGFTLPELLTASLIMVMVALVVGGGVVVAMRSYNTITERAEADMLISSELSAMKQYLVYSSYVSGNGTTETGNGNSGLNFTMSEMSGTFGLANSEGNIILVQHNLDGTEGQTLSLVTDKTITHGMTISLTNFEFIKGTVELQGDKISGIYTGTITVSDYLGATVATEDFAISPVN